MHKFGQKLYVVTDETYEKHSGAVQTQARG